MGERIRTAGLLFWRKIPGEWRIKVNDGMGHAVRATVPVNPADLESKTAVEVPGNQKNEVSKTSNPLFGNTTLGVRLFLGLSILLNIFLGATVWKRRHRPLKG
ncbi:MAG: hypothetical protein ACLFS7_07125 [Desulfosudaceae bacterium]